MKKYTYTVTEQSVDTREYIIESNAKLTQDEVLGVYTESHDGGRRVTKNLQEYISWSDDRFTDDQILNEIKVQGYFNGTEYGSDCHVYVDGDLEGGNDENL